MDYINFNDEFNDTNTVKKISLSTSSTSSASSFLSTYKLPFFSSIKDSFIFKLQLINYALYLPVIIPTFIIVIFIIYLNYLKLKFPYWSRQPVNFKHNIINIFKKHRVIENNITIINRFWEYNVKCKEWELLDSALKKEITESISKKFYLSSEAINSYFTGHNYKSFCSYLKHYEKFYGCICSKPVICYFNQNKVFGIFGKNQKNKLMANYFCFHYFIDDVSKEKLAHTHAINIYNNKGGLVTIFKKEKTIKNTVSVYGEDISNNNITFSNTLKKYSTKDISNEKTSKCKELPIKHIVSFNKHCFNTFNWSKATGFGTAHYSLISLSKQTSQNFYNIFRSSINDFDFVCFSSIGNLVSMCESGEFSINMLFYKNIPKGYLIFKKTTIDGKNIVELVGSFVSRDVENKFFTLAALISYEKLDGNIFIINGLNYNMAICKDILKFYVPNKIINTKYYFYNYIGETYKSSKCMIVI